MTRSPLLACSALVLLCVAAPRSSAQTLVPKPLPGATELESFPVPGAGPWRSRAPLPTPRSSLAASVLNGQMFALGGEDTLAGQVLGTVESFDPGLNLWSAHAPLPTPRHALTAGVVGNRIYAIGGATSHSTESAAVEEYDPGTDSWSARAPLPTPRRRAASCVVDGKVYVLGGQVGEAPLPVTRLASVAIFDPATDTWSTGTRMPSPRTDAAATVLNGRIYVIGGEPFARRVEEYDPATNKWVRRAALPRPRIAAAASTLGGQIYVLGGRDSRGHALSSLEVYDPALNTWSERADLLTPREALASAVVDSKLFALGGQLVPGALASAATEAYDALVDGTACEQEVPQQLGLAEVLGGGCPAGPGPVPGTTCLTLRVHCSGLAPIDVSLRVTEPPAGVPLRGTVVTGTGGPGLEFHSDQQGGTQLILDLRAAGFRVVDRAWAQPWFAAGANLKAESCRYATLLTWAHTNLHTTGAFGAWGNSGGAGEIGFALTTWERADLLDIAVFGGGPPMSRMDLGCLPSQNPTWAAACADLIAPGILNCAPSLCTVGATNVSCLGCSSNPTLADLRSESILHPTAVLDFPTTRVEVLIGKNDCSAASFGVLFFNAVSSQKQLQFLAGTPHQVPQTATGRAAVLQALLAGS